ncbi:TPA: hypothetical protein ACXJF2_000863 [Serratia marcescens]
MTLTTEQLNDMADGNWPDSGFYDTIKAMARECTELRAVVERLNGSGYECSDGPVTALNAAAVVDILLQQLDDAVQEQVAPPAPSVPDDYQHLKNVRELYHKQEERLFALAQRIKGASFDKYSHTTAQAIDVLEREIFGEDGDTCRAAMLAQPVSSSYRLNSPVIPDGWKLVPIDATRAMIDAAQRVEEDGYDAMHKAMLAAAPESGNDHDTRR